MFKVIMQEIYQALRIHVTEDFKFKYCRLTK